VIGDIASLKVASIESLSGTPMALFTGSTAVTVGAGGATPVVNRHEYGLANATPAARLVAPVIVTLYGVSDRRPVDGVNVYVAMVLVASRVTVPVGFMQGAGTAQVTAKLVPAVSGLIGSLKVAVMTVL
jgi:hypothetical protein